MLDRRKLADDRPAGIALASADCHSYTQHDGSVDEERPPTHIDLDIDEALQSGDPPSSFTYDSVSGQTLEGTFAPPADGQRADCPDASEDDVVTQEEFEADFDIDLCGSGTALMMPLMLLGLCWLKIRR